MSKGWIRRPIILCSKSAYLEEVDIITSICGSKEPHRSGKVKAYGGGNLEPFGREGDWEKFIFLSIIPFCHRLHLKK